MLTLKKPSSLTVIGMNTGHNGGCCLIHKDKIVAISEERLTRKKHCSGYLYSLEYVLSSLNLTINDIDKFIFSSYHKDIPNQYSGKLKCLGLDSKKFGAIDHHLSHAYSGYYFSGFDEALIVVIDGLGNNTDTESYYIGRGNKISKIGGNDNNRSIYKGIGRAYESFTNLIGRPATDAGKTMGLSSYGKFHGEEIDLFNIDSNFSITSKLDGKYEFAALDFSKQNNLKTILESVGKKEKCIDAASFVQYHLEKVICEIVDGLVKKTGIRKLCLVGGVALNGLVNQKLIDDGIIDDIYIPPFPCDTGQCVGNVIGRLAEQGIHIREKLSIPYLGREYNIEEILDVFNKKQNLYPLPYEIKKTEFSIIKLEEDQFIENVGELISIGKIVGRFQGGSELGPRALGNRSILANPTMPLMKDHINSKVKHRESFRPFAGSICCEDANEYFDINKESPFMMLIYKIKNKYIGKLPGITHIDNTCRLQTVKKEDNEKYYKLLKNLKKHTDFPMVLNTSFNDNNEPIVENPVEALRHLANGNIDVLALDNYIITILDEKN